MPQTLTFEPGMMVAMEHGYVDYAQFGQCVWFVPRANSNMAYRVVKTRELPGRGYVLLDQEIVLTGYSWAAAFLINYHRI